MDNGCTAVILLPGKLKPVIAHRDLNSRNVLVTSDLSCVICDFGFALAVESRRTAGDAASVDVQRSAVTDVSLTPTSTRH